MCPIRHRDFWSSPAPLLNHRKRPRVSANAPRSLRVCRRQLLLVPALALVMAGGLSAAPAKPGAGVGGRRAGTPSIPPAPTPAEPNLLLNGELSPDQRAWTLEQTPGKALAHLEWLPPQSLPDGRAGAVRVSVETLGAEPWHIQFHQMGLTLREGEPYTLTFWSRADRERAMTVAANVTEGDGHGIGLNAENLPLTREWQRYRLVFTAMDPVTSRCRITFLLGSSVGAVDLAGVALRHGAPGKPSGANLLRNGEFSNGGAEWSLEKTGEAVAGVDWRGEAVPGRLPGTSAVVNVQHPGKEPWHVQLVQPGIDLREGEPYELAFWGRAAQARPLSIQTIIDQPDWHPTGLTAHVHLSPEWQCYHLYFSALGTVVGHSRLAFIAGEAPGTVSLQGITLRRLGAEAPPERRPHVLIGTWTSRDVLDGSRFTFTFNGDGTGSLRTGAGAASIPQVPKAPVLNPYRWYIEGKSVIIAGRRYSWVVQPDGSRERLTLTNPLGGQYVLYRQSPLR